MFQRQCKVLFEHILNDPNVEEFGTSGQGQNGIDLLGRRRSLGLDHWVGIQCKLAIKSAKLKSGKKGVVEVEATSALSFQPSLKELIIVTTAANDGVLQQEAAQFTDRQAKLGREFTVQVWGWEMLCAHILRYEPALKAFNQAAVARICQSVAPGNYDQMRSQFAKGIARELNKMRRPEAFLVPRSTVIFSGFPPISKRLHQEITGASNARLQMIFLCSSNLEPFYTEANGMPWRRVAVPSYSIGEPLAVQDDIRRLKKRVSVASQGLVAMSDEADVWMTGYLGKPLANLKGELLRRLKVRIGDATKLAPVTL